MINKYIYLQRSDDETTWCADMINDDDIQYILKSEYDEMRETIRAILDDAQRTAVPGGYEYTINGRVMAAAKKVVNS